jgi:gas vesicle protein
MSRFRYRDDDDSYTSTIVGVLIGAMAGFAAGMVVAQRVGGFSGLRDRLRRRGTTRDERLHEAHGVADDDEEDFEDIEEDELESDEDIDEGLEERVLEAFRNDPILSERAIDIGSISEGVIELAGWVESDDEAQHAVTIARGVPDVDTVVNRIAVGEEERRYADTARRFDEGDPALTQARWEGQRVGTGRRRQGTSEDPDRHADPKPNLEDRWLREDNAIRNAADEAPGLSTRRGATRRAVRGDRTGGAPVAPTGVPKADNVVDPVRDSGGAQTERTDPM